MAINKETRQAQLPITIDPKVQQVLNQQRTYVRLLLTRKNGEDLKTMSHIRPGFIKILGRLVEGTIVSKLQRSSNPYELIQGYEGETAPLVELYISEEQYILLNGKMDELYTNGMFIEAEVPSSTTYWEPIINGAPSRTYTLENPAFCMETAADSTQAVRVQGTAKSAANRLAAQAIEEESPFVAKAPARKRAAAK